MKEIPLTQGKVAKVSDHRYGYLMQWKWYARRTGWNRWDAARGIGPRSSKKIILMHRVIMDAPDGMFVDHIDGDGLNNVDENLRICTHAENNRNKKMHRNNTLGFKGISRHAGKAYKPYEAHITIAGRKKSLGYFHTAEEAARAYDVAAKKCYGEFAKTNF